MKVHDSEADEEDHLAQVPLETYASKIFSKVFGAAPEVPRGERAVRLNACTGQS